MIQMTTSSQHVRNVQCVHWFIVWISIEITENNFASKNMTIFVSSPFSTDSHKRRVADCQLKLIKMTCNYVPSAIRVPYDSTWKRIMVEQAQSCHHDACKLKRHTLFYRTHKYVTADSLIIMIVWVFSARICCACTRVYSHPILWCPNKTK